MQSFQKIIIGIFILSGYLITTDSFKSPEEEVVIKTMRESGAYEALDFWTRSRAYPKKDIPAKTYYTQFSSFKNKLKKSSPKISGSDTWQPLGPANVPGRMISLALNPKNPNTLFAGSASGGLWRTYDSRTGDNWHRINTGFPVLGVMAIAIDPSDTNNIYIGTGEVYGYGKSIGGTVIRTTRGSYGIGILKSGDGGRTWQKSLDWTFNQQRGVQAIKINPINPNSLYAATTEGIYKSVNSGSSWNLIFPVLMGEDILIHPVDTNKVIVSCGNLGSEGSGIYYSQDAGSTWNNSSGIPGFSGKTLLDSYHTVPDIVFASVADSLQGAGLYKSVDFGINFIRLHQIDVPQYQGFFGHWVAVHPEDLNQIVHAGVQIYKSYDAGRTLSIKYGPHVDHHNYAHHPTDPNILYIACDGGVYYSENFGDNYINIGYGLQTAQFYNGFSSSFSDSNFAIGGLQDNNTVIYSGDHNWTRVIGGDGCWTAINPLNDNMVYGEYQYNNIRRSLNRGLTFSPATSGMSGDDAAFVAPFVISPSNPSVLYSGRTKVYKTVNSASNWLATNNNFPLDGNYVLSLAVSPKNENVVFAGTAPYVQRGNIFMTSNGGDSWINVTGNLPDRYPMDIGIDPIDDSIVYVVFGGFGSGHVFKSADRGDNWEDITGDLPDVPTLSITIDPLNSSHVYVGNDLGVFNSTDGGSSWSQFTEGLPESVIAMDLNISTPNRKLRVATHGNGAYERKLLFKPQSHFVLGIQNFPTVILLGHEIGFGISVTNQGSNPQEDTLNVKVLVRDESFQEFYSESTQICCLQPGESQIVEFGDPFIPIENGDYILEITKWGFVSGSVEDTVRQYFSVITPPTIAYSQIEKIYRNYEEINGGETLTKGDDIQENAILPFRFTYDNYEYDRVQISTNGWMEFGIGRLGTERGLSSADQIGNIGANDNGRLASTSRPTKAIGPWWEDLNTDLGNNSGSVIYKTLGASPQREFVVQWKNMRAYYDASSTTTRVNFQVRLHEGSNVIEFVYGSITPGTFSGPDIGAMIGIKDHIGGDYHFYDLAKGGSFPASDLITDLSPLTDWPGPDSAFVITTSIPVSVNENENIISTYSLSQNYPNPFNPTTKIRYEIPNEHARTGSTPTSIQYEHPAKSDVRTGDDLYKTNSNESQKGQHLSLQNIHVKLIVYDILGRKIKTLVNKNQTPGIYEIEFKAENLASGIYLYRLEAGKFIDVKKMILLR